MPADTQRAYCTCGAAAHLTSTSTDMIQGVLRMFWEVHAGDGHGSTTRYVAAQARRRETRQQAERRAPYERCWDRGHAMAGILGFEGPDDARATAAALLAAADWAERQGGEP